MIQTVHIAEVFCSPPGKFGRRFRCGKEWGAGKHENVELTEEERQALEGDVLVEKVAQPGGGVRPVRKPFFMVSVKKSFTREIPDPPAETALALAATPKESERRLAVLEMAFSGLMRRMEEDDQRARAREEEAHALRHENAALLARVAELENAGEKLGGGAGAVAGSAAAAVLVEQEVLTPLLSEEDLQVEEPPAPTPKKGKKG